MDKNFWQQLPKPIVALSPMDGFTDSAFRRAVRSVAPDVVVVTEFTSAEGLHHEAQRIVDRFRYDPSEQPIIAQIFGADEKSFVHAAQWLEAKGFSGIDINMGCPSKKVVKSEQGIALRKNHDLAFRLVNAVASATSLPVSVKTRLGLVDASDLLEFGKGVYNAGANLITIHGRTYDEPYGVPAHFDPIYQLKNVLPIPVLGNGGITSRADGIAKLGNLDGFMIGQAAIGNPWVFTDSTPELQHKIPVILNHTRWLVELYGPYHGIRIARKHLVAYVKALPNARDIRNQLVHAESVDEVSAILDSVAVGV